ncbi:MAG TPA: hypothetical protein VNF06_03150, partial [Candidatus Aquilonibacter sp.]|nr:hypothetical protein [Candidatus Aquilonibacter sp.]
MKRSSNEAITGREQTRRISLVLAIIKKLQKKSGARYIKVLEDAESQGLGYHETMTYIHKLEDQGDVYSPMIGRTKSVTPREKIRRRPLLERKKKIEKKAWIKYGKLREAFMRHFSMSEETADQFAIQCMQRWTVFSIRWGPETSETKLGNLLCYYSPKTDWVDGMMDLRAKLNKELKPWEEHWKELAKMVREK